MHSMCSTLPDTIPMYPSRNSSLESRDPGDPTLATMVPRPSREGGVGEDVVSCNILPITYNVPGREGLGSIWDLLAPDGAIKGP